MTKGETERKAGLMWVLGDEEFEYFRNVVYRESGIRLTELKKALVQARLTKRLSLFGWAASRVLRVRKEALQRGDSQSHQLHHHQQDGFLQGKQAFRIHGQHRIPGVEGRKKRKIRIWSAGCSTGRGTLHHSPGPAGTLPEIAAADVKILATDIDTTVLDRGRDGIYSAEIVPDIDTDVLKKYFLTRPGPERGEIHGEGPG